MPGSSNPTPPQTNKELSRNDYCRLAEPLKQHLMNQGLSEIPATSESGLMVNAQTPAVLALLARERDSTRQQVEKIAKQINLHDLAVSIRGMHYANIIVRNNGKDVVFEADWLKYLMPIICPEEEAEFQKRLAELQSQVQEDK